MTSMNSSTLIQIDLHFKRKIITAKEVVTADSLPHRRVKTVVFSANQSDLHARYETYYARVWLQRIDPANNLKDIGKEWSFTLIGNMCKNFEPC